MEHKIFHGDVWAHKFLEIWVLYQTKHPDFDLMIRQYGKELEEMSYNVLRNDMYCVASVTSISLLDGWEEKIKELYDTCWYYIEKNVNGTMNISNIVKNMTLNY